MKKTMMIWIGLALITWNLSIASPKDLEIEGKNLISKKPPFALILPSELRSIHSFLQEHPDENSLTRAYFFIKDKDKQVEEMFIVQIADRTNPQAEPMTAPPLKPYNERRMYSKGKIKKGEVEINYLIQLMAWNPDAPSLQPLVKRGIVIPSRWALQGQFLFVYQGEHAILIRYSRDVNSFGLRVSGEWKNWEKDGISGNEKKVYETFKKNFMEIIDSVRIKNP